MVNSASLVRAREGAEVEAAGETGEQCDSAGVEAGDSWGGAGALRCARWRNATTDLTSVVSHKYGYEAARVPPILVVGKA